MAVLNGRWTYEFMPGTPPIILTLRPLTARDHDVLARTTTRETWEGKAEYLSALIVGATGVEVEEPDSETGAVVIKPLSWETDRELILELLQGDFDRWAALILAAGRGRPGRAEGNSESASA